MTILSQGRLTGSRSVAFRQSSKSFGRGRHDHGLDVGARRNAAHEMAAKQKDDQNKKNKEKELAKRKEEAEKRLKQMAEEISVGTKERTKIQNVSRPSVSDANVAPKLSKTAEIIRKIVEERVIGFSLLTENSKTLKNYKSSPLPSSEYAYFKHPNGNTLLIKKHGPFHAVHRTEWNDKMYHFNDKHELTKHIDKMHAHEKNQIQPKQQAVMRKKIETKPVEKTTTNLRKKSDYKPLEKKPVAAGWTTTFSRK